MSRAFSDLQADTAHHNGKIGAITWLWDGKSGLKSVKWDAKKEGEERTAPQ